jgi:hypothetical protein
MPDFVEIMFDQENGNLEEAFGVLHQPPQEELLVLLHSLLQYLGQEQPFLQP